jgi:integrase
MIGISTLHNHDLRHSGSNILKNLGMDVQDIAELLHHESTETTVKHYLCLDKKKIKANKDKFIF